MNEFLQRIEKLSPKRLALLACELQSRVEKLERPEQEPIAIVGLGCRMPGGANNPERFWELMASGRDALREVPADRWEIDAWYDADPDAPGKMSTRWGGFLDQVDQFDAAFFGISRREAVSMDPQQRLLLEVCWEALEHAGQSPRALAGSRTGVYLGLSTSDYHTLLRDRGAESIDAYLATGTAHSIAAGRIAYVLGLHGPNFAIDTACSSSLAAVHLACLALRAGDCEMALAGGVNAVLAPEITVALSKSHMMAPDGRCKTFDSRADGFVRGEGCGMVVLRRLSDAIARGDRILAVIRGSAVNQDGRSNGISAPNGASQELVIREALANAGVQPNEIGYIEAHGTGTALGDPIEAHALAAVFGPGRSAARPLLLGSVKTAIGHLEAAAGIAGLIKMVLALQHEYLPPHLHFRKWNPHIDWNGMPVEVTVGGRTWTAGDGPRRAGVSSFGFSGTNVHLVLEEAPAGVGRATGEDRPVHVVALSARTPQALERVRHDCAEYLSRSREPLADIAFTANAGRAHFEHRIATVGSSAEEVRARLQEPAVRGSGEKRRDFVFLFTGQGAQYAGMGRDLYLTQPVFRAALEECDRLLRPLLEVPLLDVLYGERADWLAQTAYTQPALVALEYALAELWKSWGIQPAAVLGHSVGEYAAACVAGLCTIEQALTLIADRARSMQELPGDGAMAAVMAEEAVVREALRGHEQRVSIAAINAPGNIVISGERGAMEAIRENFTRDGVRVVSLAVSHAFHSPQMEPMAAEFAQRAARVGFGPGRVRMISSVTGEAVSGEQLRNSEYWRRQVRETVQFRRGMEALSGHSVFVEIGPGSTLVGLGRQTLESGERVWLPSTRQGQEWRQMLSSLAALYERGAEVDWAGFDRPYDRRRVALPTYPFERQRYWMEAAPAASAAKRSGGLRHAWLDGRLPSAVPIYQGRLSIEACPFLADHRAGGTAVLPAAGYIELALAAAAETSGVQSGAVCDLSLREPLHLQDRAHEVQVVLSPSEHGEAAFQIFARPEDTASEGHWTLHATGRLASPGSVPASNKFAAPTEEIEPEVFYAALSGRGFELGATSRVLQKLCAGGGAAVAEIDGSDAEGWQAHPLVLDGWFQTLGAAVLYSSGSRGTASYVVAGVDTFRLLARPKGRLKVHARISTVENAGTMFGEFRVFDASGATVALAEGVRLRRINEPSPDAVLANWFYQVEWQPAGGPNGVECGRRYAMLRPRLERIAALHIADTLRQLGIPLEQGGTIGAPAARNCGVIERHERLFARMMEILREDGVLKAGPEGWSVLDAPDCTGIPALWDDIEREFPEFAAETELTRRCAPVLASVLRGTTDPLELLFPNGSFAALEKLYRESPIARATNARMARAVAEAIESLPTDRTVRVLEIGAGTGSSTVQLARVLPAGRVDYTFTDVSPLFLARAKESLSEYPFLRYRLLDIERDPAEQGFEGMQFDIVVAANVLHATSDLRRAVMHAKNLLAPGGLLVALEGTRPERWVDLTFGLTEGWWKYADQALRPEHPLLAEEKWVELLKSLGCVDVEAVEPARGGNQVLLTGRAPGPRSAAGRWLLTGPPSSLTKEIAARIRRFPGTVDEVVPAGCTPEILQRGSYDHVVYVADPTAGVPDAGKGCLEVVNLVRHLAACENKSSRLWLVTRGAQPVGVAGPGAISVAQAPLWGLARTVALEFPEFWGGIVDLDPTPSDREGADGFADAVLIPDGEDQVALRSSERYVPRLVRRPAPPARSYRFVPDGSYLITGGLGRLGLSVARWMAANGARRIVLVGRTASRPTPEQARVIREIEALGATVRRMAIDISAPGQLDALSGSWEGGLRGVIHASAVFDWARLADLTPASFAAVMQPKVAGTWALHEWSKGQKLDFFVMFSSTTSLLGSSNLAHYAAANQFLDAMAHQRAADGLPGLSINWGTWEEMGGTPEEQRRLYREAGLHPMASGPALEALGRLLGTDTVQATVADIDWDRLRALYESRRARPLLTGLKTGRGGGDTTRPAAAASGLAARVIAAEPRERAEIVTGLVRQQAAEVLGLQPEEVDVHAGLFELGMDSLMSVELKGRLQKGTGLELASTLTFNYPSVHALSAYLSEKLAPGLKVEPEAPASAAAATEAPDDRSEDELAALLEATLGTL